MPLFTYQCPRSECQAEIKAMRCIADHANGPLCYRCGKAQMNQILDPTPGIVKDPAVPKKSK
jgi:predicted nucleic acid-binding Zn ribbon protein